MTDLLGVLIIGALLYVLWREVRQIVRRSL
jgi:hypothetical protein